MTQTPQQTQNSADRANGPLLQVLVRQRDQWILMQFPGET